MSAVIRADEWLAELQRLSRGAVDDGTFRTTAQLASEAGVPEARIRKLLRSGLESGAVVHGKVPRTQLNGIVRLLDAYKIVPVASVKEKGRGK